LVGIVVVSHSAELARGVVDLAGQMAGPEVSIEAAGGGPDGGLGTNEPLVREAMARAQDGQGVAVLADLGSSILTVLLVLEDHESADIRLADAPLVEGAVAAAVMASAGGSLDQVVAAAEEARSVGKL
jgi:phosphoenolpyruvate---glycerone phosphotransferase subunit DhaM